MYATLSRLARDGKAVAGPVEQGAGPERRRYVITEEGVADVEKWLAEPAPPEPDLQSELFAKVVLALMLGQQADSYLDAQRAAHLQRMRELTELKRHGDPLDVLLADHALYRLEADLRWIDHTAARLDLLARAVRVSDRHRADAVTGELIEARDLSLSFGETPALRGASLAVRRGEIVAVMGPSGSGKSTLLHCLAGILVPERGRGLVRRAAARHPQRRPAQRAAPGPVRVRVPVRPAGPRADRRGERRAAAAAVRHPPRAGDGGGQEVVPRARPGRA